MAIYEKLVKPLQVRIMEADPTAVITINEATGEIDRIDAPGLNRTQLSLLLYGELPLEKVRESPPKEPKP
jgi:hypothetical protein